MQHLRLGRGTVGEAEGAGETLVALGIVVLQRDLNINGLDEVTLLALLVLTAVVDLLAVGEGDDVIDSLVEELGVEFVSHGLCRGHFFQVMTGTKTICFLRRRGRGGGRERRGTGQNGKLGAGT